MPLSFSCRDCPLVGLQPLLLSRRTISPPPRPALVATLVLPPVRPLSRHAMRLSLRIASAAALIIFALLLINRNLHPDGEIPQSIWRFDTTSFRAALRQQQPTQDPPAPRKWGTGTGLRPSLNYQTTPIEVPNEGIIVMGKKQDEDTAWVSAELAE